MGPEASRVSPSRRLVQLAWPIVGINVLGVAMLAVDSAFCGRLPHPAADLALEALGYCTQVVVLLMIAILGLHAGLIGLVARAHGAGDTERAHHLVTQGLQLTILVGVTIGIAGTLLARPILVALGASDAVADTGVSYLRPLMLGIPFNYIAMFGAGVFRAVGNTRTPLVVVVIENIVNAAINYVLVLGHFGAPQLGVRGSAIGWDIASASAAVMILIAMRRSGIPTLRVGFAPRAIDRPLARELLRIGWPAAVDMLVPNASFLSVLGMLGRIDQVTVAAHGLGLRVQSLAFVPSIAIGQATGALVAQALGAKDVPAAREVVRTAIKLSLVVMVTLLIVVAALAVPLVRLFDVTPGSPLEDYAVMWIRIFACGLPATAVNMALIGMFHGAGQTRTSLFLNVWSILVLQIPLAWLLGFGLGLGALGVWLSFPFALALKCTLAIVLYRRGAWAVTGVAAR